MSFVNGWRTAIRDSDLDSTAKLVAHTLATFADRAGTCWPSQGTLAAAVSMNVWAVHKATQRLEAAGFLIVERSRGRGSHHYEFVFPTPEEVEF